MFERYKGGYLVHGMCMPAQVAAGWLVQLLLLLLVWSQVRGLTHRVPGSRDGVDGVD
jgi:hypothetical protein